jgi:putative phosphoesterase
MPPEFNELADLLPVTVERVFPVPLTVGVISDTHVNPKGSRRIPLEVFDLFERFKVDLLIHAGDANYEDVYERLSRIAPLIAVYGNNETPFLKRALPGEVELMIGPHRVGVIHGHQGSTARQTAKQVFGGRVDFCIYGHSHIPKIERIESTTYFNPGSATDRRWGEFYGLGIVRFGQDATDPELVLYRTPAHLENVKP